MGLTAELSEPYFIGAYGVAPPTSDTPGAINLLGSEWMLDLTTDEFRRRTVQMTREQLNTGAGSGEEALASAQIWRRSVTSWHHGAGQKYYDDVDERDSYRFWSSRRVDVWTEGQISLLPSTELAVASATETQWVLPVADALWLTQGSGVKVYDSLWTVAASTTLAGVPNAVASGGDRLYVCLPSKLIEVTRSGGSLTQTDVLAQHFDGIAYQAGRLFVWAGPVLSEVRFSPTANLQLIEQRPAGFKWTGVRQAGGGLFAAGNDGSRGTVWLLTIDPDAASGWAPARQMLELPDGERIRSGDSYLGFLLLATDAGLRLVQVSSDGSLVSGAPLETPVSEGPVGFEGQGRFVWAGSMLDGQASLVRMDLSTFTSPLTPAWASDLEASNVGVPLSGEVWTVTTYAGLLMFTVSGVGLVAQSATLEPQGELVQGWVTYGTADPKTPADWTVQTEPLPGGTAVTVTVNDTDSNIYFPVTHSEDGAVRTVGRGAGAQSDGTLTTINLTGGPTSGPVLLRWDMRSAPSTRRATVWTLPIVISEQLDMGGVSARRHPEVDYTRLVDSVLSGKLTALQVAHQVHTVQCIEFDWRPRDKSADLQCWNGVFVIQCLTVEGDI